MALNEQKKSLIEFKRTMDIGARADFAEQVLSTEEELIENTILMGGWWCMLRNRQLYITLQLYGSK